MTFCCGTCNGREFYLQAKGNAVGMYCVNCGKWFKWVGKKELVMLRRQGYKIYPADSEVSLNGDVPKKVGKKENIYGNSTLSMNMGLAEEMPTVDSKIIVSSVTKNEEKDSLIENEREMKPCNFCTGENFESIGDSFVDVMSMDNALIVTDKGGNKIMASYRINYCPMCGRKLN